MSDSSENGPHDQLLRNLEKAFVEEGGLREHMTRERLTEWAKQGTTR